MRVKPQNFTRLRVKDSAPHQDVSWGFSGASRVVPGLALVKVSRRLRRHSARFRGSSRSPVHSPEKAASAVRPKRSWANQSARVNRVDEMQFAGKPAVTIPKLAILERQQASDVAFILKHRDDSGPGHRRYLANHRDAETHCPDYRSSTSVPKRLTSTKCICRHASSTDSPPHEKSSRNSCSAQPAPGRHDALHRHRGVSRHQVTLCRSSTGRPS